MPSPAPTRQTAQVVQRAFLGLVAVIVLVLSVLAATWRPLWYDELFTLCVARQASFVDVLQALLAGADTNPPLDYLLRHAGLDLSGSSPASFRFPSAVAFLAGMFAIYRYVRRRVPFTAAAVAFLFPVGTAASFFAYEGRAYALLFASAPLALLAWQRAIDRPGSPVRLLALVAALLLGPFSHYFGVLSVGAVASGEIWRCITRRRVDWGIVAAFGVAGLSCLLLVPFARNALGMQATFWAAQGSLLEALRYYRAYLDYSGRSALIVIAASIPVALLGFRRSIRSGAVDVPVHEIVAGLAVALTPVSAYALAALATGVVISKYAITLVPGLAILAGYLVAVVECSFGAVVAAVPVALLSVSALGHFAADAAAYRGSEPIPPDIDHVLRRSSLPVAFDSPHAYLEYVHYAPDLAPSRFFYPMDAPTALRFRGFNNDEIALRGLRRIVTLNVEDYASFTTGHAEFLVLYRQDFAPALTRALVEDGFCLRVEGRSERTLVLRATRPCR